MSAKYVLRAIHLFLCVLWPTVTYAAGSTFGASFEVVGVLSWVMVLVLSTVAGMTALLNRIATALQEDNGKSIPSMWLFVASNLFGSWLTGLFFFLVCQHFETPDFLEAAVVIGASYVGARLIERTMEGAVESLVDRMSLMLGGRPRDSQLPSRLPDSQLPSRLPEEEGK
jgi:cation transport ATPase